MEDLYRKEWTGREKDFLYDNASFYSFFDPNPVSKGHALIAAKRKGVKSLADLTEKEHEDFFDILEKAKTIVEMRYHPQGYNVGVNEGVAAGQTIMHLHVHIIPRYKGDVPNPRGGIRNVIPGKGDYIQKN